MPAEIENDGFGLGGRPYLVCLGRIEAGKGTSALAEMFAAHKHKHPGPLLLVMVGPAADHPTLIPTSCSPARSSEALKWALIDGSLGLIAPSRFRVLRSDAAGCVDASSTCTGQCRVRGDARAVRTVGRRAFLRSFEQFEEAVTRLAADGELRESSVGGAEPTSTRTIAGHT